MPMAIPLIAAYATVSAGIAAGGLIGGMMVAGGMLTGLGALTGDKELSKWGGLLSLAGGAAGMASGSWASAADSAAAASTSADKAALFSDAGYGAADAATAVDAAGAASGAAPGASAGATGVADAAPTTGLDGPAVADQAPIALAPNTAAPPINAAPTTAPLTAAPAAAPATAPVAAGTTTAPTTVPADQSVMPPFVNPSSGVQPAQTPGGGLLQSVKDFGQYIGDPKNGRVVQAGAGLLQAGLGAYGQQDAIRTQIQMQEDARARERARLNASMAGLKVPVYQSTKQG